MTPFTRRSFLTGTAATFGSLAASQVFAQPRGPAPKKLGFAIVGIGSLAMGQILPAFADAKLCKPVALVSGHPDKAAQQAAKYGIDPKNIYNYDNFDTIKDNPAIDVVYIVLPNGMHAEYSIRAAKAGKHVLCEKPMANTPEECQSMIDASAAAKRKLFVAYRMHYDPTTQMAIQTARNEMGGIKLITAECGFAFGNPNQWRCNKKLAGGGSLMDIGIYALNAVRYLSGQEPTAVSAVAYSTPDNPCFKEVEETINLQLTFASGLLANVLSTYSISCNRFHVMGTPGHQMEAEPFQGFSDNHLWPSGRNNGEFTYKPVNQFAVEMDALCDSIQTNKPILTPGEEGLADLKVMAAAYESAKTGKSVKIV